MSQTSTRGFLIIALLWVLSVLPAFSQFSGPLHASLYRSPVVSANAAGYVYPHTDRLYFDYFRVGSQMTNSVGGIIDFSPHGWNATNNGLTFSGGYVVDDGAHFATAATQAVTAVAGATMVAYNMWLYSTINMSSVNLLGLIYDRADANGLTWYSGSGGLIEWWDGSGSWNWIVAGLPVFPQNKWMMLSVLAYYDPTFVDGYVGVHTWTASNGVMVASNYWEWTPLGIIQTSPYLLLGDDGHSFFTGCAGEMQMWTNVVAWTNWSADGLHVWLGDMSNEYLGTKAGYGP